MHFFNLNYIKLFLYYNNVVINFCLRCQNLSEYMKIAEKVKEFFHNEGIHSTTIQPEFEDVNLICLLKILTFPMCHVHVYKIFKKK